MSERPEPITLRVGVFGVFGVDAADVTKDAFDEGRAFFGEDADLEIVSGEIQKKEGGDYTGEVVIRRVPLFAGVEPKPNKREQLLAGIQQEGGTWDAPRALNYYNQVIGWWPTSERVEQNLRLLAEDGRLVDLGRGRFTLPGTEPDAVAER